MARILLVDADSTIPNLALMKLSMWHKMIGDEVDLIRCNISYYPDHRKNVIVDNANYDATYVSAIFRGTAEYVTLRDLSNVIWGGTGINNKSRLSPQVENCDLDYSIYPDNDAAYGFISRGCDRDCYFCGVPEKEGRTHQVETDIQRIIGGFKKVKFMDNNFLQLPNHLEILAEIADIGILCQFNQGLDFRMITLENSIALSKLNYMGEFIFAFDDWGYRKMLDRQLRLLDWMPDWKAKFYVYVHPSMSLSATVKRIEFLKDRKLLPYVMRDISCWGSEHQDFYTDLAGYANQPGIFKKMSFVDYAFKRAIGVSRKIDFINKYAEALYASDRKTIRIGCAA